MNPLEQLLRTTGRWALVMLLLALAVAPARRAAVALSQALGAGHGKRLSDWNWLVRLRRQFGLLAFFYACMHLGCYLVFDAGMDMAALRDDLRERPFVLLGLAAFVLLVPLAASSNQAAMRALGRWWQTLHLLAYAVLVLAQLHFWLQMKLGETRALPFAAVAGLLLALRLRARWQGERSPGIEVAPRA